MSIQQADESRAFISVVSDPISFFTLFTVRPTSPDHYGRWLIRIDLWDGELKNSYRLEVVVLEPPAGEAEKPGWLADEFISAKVHTISLSGEVEVRFGEAITTQKRTQEEIL